MRIQRQGAVFYRFTNAAPWRNFLADSKFMNFMIAGFIGGWELILILAVVLLLFGSKKLPELAKGLGQGIKEFKKSSRDDV